MWIVFFTPVSIWVWLPFSLIFFSLFHPHPPCHLSFLTCSWWPHLQTACRKRKKKTINVVSHSSTPPLLLFSLHSLSLFSFLFDVVVVILYLTFTLNHTLSSFFICLLFRSLSLLLITPLLCLHAECRHQGHTVIRGTQNLQSHTDTHMHTRKTARPTAPTHQMFECVVQYQEGVII